MIEPLPKEVSLWIVPLGKTDRSAHRRDLTRAIAEADGEALLFAVYIRLKAKTGANPF